MGWFEDATGYTSVGDMFDGGGAGGSGDTYYSGSHEDYVTGGGTGGVAHNTSDDSNSGNSGGSNTTTIDGNTVTYDGTPGEGDFFVYDDTFIDPYEYLDLMDAGYSDNAAFDLSYYSESDDPDNPTQDPNDAEWYSNNPTSTITPDQYNSAQKVSKLLGVFAGPLFGLGFKAITEMQKKGIIPGNTSTSWFENKEIGETTGSSADDQINEILNSDMSDGEQSDAIEDLINQLITDEQLAGITAAVGSMATSAFGESDVQDVADNAENYMPTEGLEDQVPTLDPDATGTNIDSEDFKQPEEDIKAGLSTAGDADTVGNVEAGVATGYDVETTADKLDSDFYSAEGAVGTVSADAKVIAEQLDIDSTASGINAVGKALNDFAKVDISRVIDTSTVQGKLLADRLGEGNYVDSKSTILGQMKIISEEFKDSNGNPKIPAWAQGQARSVQRTIAFKGMTGTAATAAMSNAIMEASLGVAEKEASFFQTLTVENLNNKQEAVINKANILSKFELANLDARMTAAVENARAFLQMDLANLDNRQQAEIVNTQLRVDALLEDSKAKNAERLFTADAENDFTKFYDELAVSIDRFNATQKNEMERFNIGETNDNSEFNAKLDNDREQFYKDLQYNIDLANAKWRQTVTLEEASMKFEAAKFDTQNLFDLTSDALNRVWDREDSIFDYIWKSSETERERLVDLYEVDKEYEVEMRKISNDEAYKGGQADWEVFKWGWDLISGDGPFGLW